MRALLYPRQCYRARFLAGFLAGGLNPAWLCRPPPSIEARIEHYAQALVTRISFARGSAGGAAHISVIVVKFLTVPLNRQIKVLYHGIESISR